MEETYYKKILVSSGEVPEEEGEYITDRGVFESDQFGFWFMMDNSSGEAEPHYFQPDYYLKPVPSPKQEADIIKLLRMKLENEISLNNGDYFLVDLNKVFSLDLSVSS